MRIDIVSVLPELMEAPATLHHEAGAERLAGSTPATCGIRTGQTPAVDDYQYGTAGRYGDDGGTIWPIASMIFNGNARWGHFTRLPDGAPPNQPLVNRLSMYENLLILCGITRGMDEPSKKLCHHGSVYR